MFAPTGPVLLWHVTPLTPMIDHVAVPEGDAPPVAPVKVAVKVNEEPRVAVDADVVTATVGATRVIVNEYAALGPAVV